MTIPLHLEPARLDAVVEDCLNEAATQLASRSLAVTRQIGSGIGASMMDRALVKEAVACIIAAAIRSVETGGRLRVTVKANRNATMLAVKAPGQGLTEVQREVLFTGEAKPGTLARARAIVTAHGGMAWANGRPARGATYYVTLPTRVAAEPPAEHGRL